MSWTPWGPISNPARMYPITNGCRKRFINSPAKRMKMEIPTTTGRSVFAGIGYLTSRCACSRRPQSFPNGVFQDSTIARHFFLLQHRGEVFSLARFAHRDHALNINVFRNLQRSFGFVVIKTLHAVDYQTVHRAL